MLIWRKRRETGFTFRLKAITTSLDRLYVDVRFGHLADTEHVRSGR